MDTLQGQKQSGSFGFSPDRILYGELTVDGRATSLYLRDTSFFSTHNIPDRCIHGVLHDLTKVSLLGCITTEGPGSFGRYGEGYNFSRVFPHYVAHGDRHISPLEEVITSIHFVINDADTLFYDFDAFARLVDAKPFINQIVEAQTKVASRKIEIGPHPEILYFTGKSEIFSADTIIGKVSAVHGPTSNAGGPNGVYLRNTIFISIDFFEPTTFDLAIDRLLTLLRYLELMVGRRQGVLRVIFNTVGADDQSGALEVHWSLRPTREVKDNERRLPHPADVLVDAARQPEEFSRVLANWLSRQESWHDPRLRFSYSFNKEDYEIDRLVAAANMFDILPSSAVPDDIAIPSDLQEAKERCRDIFRVLPVSPERDSVLSALGRVGKSNLKQKIHHRIRIVNGIMADRFPELALVADEAVNCRNHYVHGSPASFDYSENFRLFVFFIATLEFVFAASDLIEAGWDIRSWSTRSSAMSHPFASLRVDYAQNLGRLKELLATGGGA